MNEVTTLAPSDPWAAFLQRAMTDPNFDTTKFGALLEMRHREMEQQRIERAEERKKIFSEAMTAFQGNVEPIVRDAVNPFLKNKYATLLKTVETAQPHLKEYGLYVRYVSASAEPGWLKMGIVICHTCGYEDEPFWLNVQITDTGSKGGKLPMTPSQAVAATATYLRRQLFTNALNLVAGEIDDDGEALRTELRAGQYDAPRQPAWQVWVDKLQAALVPLATTAAVDELGERKTIKDAMARAPQWARDEALAMFAEQRIKCEGYAQNETKPDGEDDIPWEGQPTTPTQPKPGGEAAA